jgi:hypothetical protein
MNQSKGYSDGRVWGFSTFGMNCASGSASTESRGGFGGCGLCRFRVASRGLSKWVALHSAYVFVSFEEIFRFLLDAGAREAHT